MKIGTVRLLTHILLSTGVHFVVKRVILLLLPPVREFASVLMLATICIRGNEVLGLPIGTLILFILIDMWFSPEVLPVMRIHTNISCMGRVTVGTPDSLEVEHIEISILFKFIEQINGDFFLRMSESAHISIVTTLHLLGVSLTKLDLILFRVVEFFHSVVRARTTVSKRTVLMLLGVHHIGADFAGVGAKHATAVLFGFVIIETLFWVVLVGYLALLSLEVVEVDKDDDV
jgi:hypothetical protein